jgi:hypothetical protein
MFLLLRPGMEIESIDKLALQDAKGGWQVTEGRFVVAYCLVLISLVSTWAPVTTLWQPRQLIRSTGTPALW